ncbi:MAG: hypothetical protein WAM95_12010 [Bacillus sp. (in: firmicutes)]
MQFLTNWIEHYGYVILFLSLMLELIALPIPGEFLMGYAGVLVFQGKFSWILSIVISGIGSCTGMTMISHGDLSIKNTFCLRKKHIFLVLVFKENNLINLAVLKPAEEQNLSSLEKMEALLFGMVSIPDANIKRQ